MSGARPVEESWTARSGVIALALFVLAAPTAGDIGSCGQAVEDLDPVKFFTAKQRIDCEQCTSCGLATQTCAAACAGDPVAQQFPMGCYPLVHDGEVCLHALEQADCDDYATFIDDLAPASPTECNFCPNAGAGAP